MGLKWTYRRRLRITKMADFDFLENCWANNPQIYTDNSSEDSYIITWNDVINYFRLPASDINVFILGHVGGRDFSITDRLRKVIQVRNRLFLPLDEAVISIVSGSDGRTETLLEPAK